MTSEDSLIRNEIRRRQKEINDFEVADNLEERYETLVSVSEIEPCIYKIVETDPVKGGRITYVNKETQKMRSYFFQK